MILDEDGKKMLDDLEELLSRLTDAQKQLILLSAKSKAFPDNNTLKKIAILALNISAVEALIADARARRRDRPRPTIEQWNSSRGLAGVRSASHAQTPGRTHACGFEQEPVPAL